MSQSVSIAFYGGDAARGVEENLEAATADIMATLTQAYGDDFQQPTEVMCSDCSKDPNAYGAYMHIKDGYTDKDCDVLAKPIQYDDGAQLVFAGEHTNNVHSGGMPGAFKSGVRAAKQCLENAARYAEVDRDIALAKEVLSRTPSRL